MSLTSPLTRLVGMPIAGSTMRRSSHVSQCVNDPIALPDSSMDIPTSGETDSGTNMFSVEQATEEVIAHTYSGLDASTFRTRSGPNYKKNGLKLPSLPALCDLAAIDFVECNTSRVDNIGSHVHIPEEWAKCDTHHPSIPPIFIVNAQLPSDFSTSFFKTVDNGPGWSLVLYFKLSKTTCDALADLDNAPPAVKLFARYCMEAPECFLSSAKPSTASGSSRKSRPLANPWAGRFKTILRCEQIEQYGLPSFVTSYNAKPVLIKNTGTLIRGISAGNACPFVEMDINIHSFGSVPKKALEVMFNRFHQMQISIGFCIESRDENEMPEVLFGCARINMPTHSSAVAWHEFVQEPSDMNTKDS